MSITFLFERLEDFKASVDAPQPQTYGRPKSYADENLIVLLAILTLKGIYSFKAQHRWLKTHPQWLCHFKLEKVPSRATLSRRYKQLADLLEALVVYLGDVGMPLIGSSSTEWFIKTKVCLRQKVQSGIRKTEMPITFQRVYMHFDTDASWSKSHYHGWVYGSR